MRSRSATLGSIVFQRTVDARIMFFLAAAASLHLFATNMPRPVIRALIIACLFAVAATVVIVVFNVLKRAVPSWVPETVPHRIGAFQTGMLSGLVRVRARPSPLVSSPAA